MQRPVQTVAADGLFGVATGMMLIRSGLASIVAVEAHSKVSDVRTLGAIEAFALDPVLNRPLRFPTLAVAGLDMNAFLERTGLSEEHCSMVAAKNRSNALDNPRAAYPADLDAEDVDGSSPVAWPLKTLEVAERADGCVVVVLAAEERARELTEGPVRLLGAGWSSGSPSLESRTWGETEPVTKAAESAYRQAEIADPQEEIDLAEVDDTFAYKELLHLEALGFGEASELAQLLEEGELEPGGDLPVNVLGRLARAGEPVRGERARPAARVRRAAPRRGRRTPGRRGLRRGRAVGARRPSTSAAVIVLANDEGAGG